MFQCDNPSTGGYFLPKRARAEDGQMAAFDDDDRPKKKVAHEIGQDLSLLSVEELRQRIELMQSEIVRLEADIGQKQVKRAAADQFFKK
jgi:uncharacterized small protein (DUF1192 family)